SNCRWAQSMIFLSLSRLPTLPATHSRVHISVCFCCSSGPRDLSSTSSPIDLLDCQLEPLSIAGQAHRPNLTHISCFWTRLPNYVAVSRPLLLLLLAYFAPYVLSLAQRSTTAFLIVSL
ncbi:hypothetical protein R3P38DRAFT_3029631, partial [Favolaschia claudopus]